MSTVEARPETQEIDPEQVISKTRKLVLPQKIASILEKNASICEPIGVASTLAAIICKTTWIIENKPDQQRLMDTALVFSVALFASCWGTLRALGSEENKEVRFITNSVLPHIQPHVGKLKDKIVKPTPVTPNLINPETNPIPLDLDKRQG